MSEEQTGTRGYLWQSLEAIPGLVAVAAVWRAWLAEGFAPFQAAFLQARAQPARSVPCPRECGCAHEVVRHPDGSLVAVCRCEPWSCEDLSLTLADVTLWELSWSRLGRSVCKAFGLDGRLAKLGLPNTLQIGSWSAVAVPVILTIPSDRQVFQRVVAELVGRLRQPFILLAPTNTHLDAACLELLHHARAAFFDLQSNLVLTRHSNLQALKPPGELLAEFTPESERPPPTTPTKPRYALRKGLGVWHLSFDGKEADLRHERGIFYVAWLLHNPPEHPIHALDLAAKIPEIYRHQLGLAPLLDPATGKAAPVESHARIQERSLALDDAQAMRALLRKEKELEAILDSEDESEPVKAEALRELEAIAEFQRHHGARSKDSAQRAVRAVRMAITRLHQHLLTTLDLNGDPHPVLRPFAAHIEKHLLMPSARERRPAGSRTQGPPAGSFTYDPPPGVTWTD